MTIKVLFSDYSIQERDDVISFYNIIKPLNKMPLQNLDRAEGGFEIVDGDNPSKQLRWKNNELVQYYGHPSFSDDEIQLLYKSLCKVFSKDKIIIS